MAPGRSMFTEIRLKACPLLAAGMRATTEAFIAVMKVMKPAPWITRTASKAPRVVAHL